MHTSWALACEGDGVRKGQKTQGSETSGEESRLRFLSHGIYSHGVWERECKRARSWRVTGRSHLPRVLAVPLATLAH